MLVNVKEKASLLPGLEFWDLPIVSFDFYDSRNRHDYLVEHAVPNHLAMVRALLRHLVLMV